VGCVVEVPINDGTGRYPYQRCVVVAYVPYEGRAVHRLRLFNGTAIDRIFAGEHKTPWRFYHVPVQTARRAHRRETPQRWARLGAVGGRALAADAALPSSFPSAVGLYARPCASDLMRLCAARLALTPPAAAAAAPLRRLAAWPWALEDPRPRPALRAGGRPPPPARLSPPPIPRTTPLQANDELCTGAQRRRTWRPPADACILLSAPAGAACAGALCL